MAYIGSLIIIECKSTGQPIWKRNGGVLVNPEKSNQFLILRSVQQQDNGVYSCLNLIPEAEVFIGGNLNMI